MAEEVSFNKRIQPACLPDKSHCFSAGTRCVATGWGYIEEGGPRSNLLREVAVRIMESEHCNRADYYNGRIHEGMLCAGTLLEISKLWKSKILHKYLGLNFRFNFDEDTIRVNVTRVPEILVDPLFAH